MNESINIGTSYRIGLTGLPVVDGIRQSRSGIYMLGTDRFTQGNVFRFKPDIDLEDLWKAYLADGYVQRAVDLMVSIMCRSGIVWSTTSRVLDNYLQARFEIARAVNGYGWEELLWRMAFDFVLFGNVFLVKSYTSQVSAIYGKQMPGRIVAAWYPVPARAMTPVLNREGTELQGWKLTAKALDGSHRTVSRYFSVRDVVHLAYRKPEDSVWGVPVILGAVEDVRSLRQIEEDVLRMVNRFVNPKLHISMPDITGTGAGVRPDMQQLVEAINTMSSDAVLVTMPGQEVKVIGAESFALRAEPYLKYFQRRSLSGLWMNDVVAGHVPAADDADILDVGLRSQLQMAQQHFLRELMQKIVLPLLKDAGFNRGQVELVAGDVDPRHTLRLHTIIANLYSQNVISLREARRMMGMDESLDVADSYLWNVQLPRVLEPIRLQAQLGLRGGGSAGASSGGGEPSRPRGRPPKEQ